MTLASMVLGYAGLGFATRCYALGIQKRNIFDSACRNGVQKGGKGKRGHGGGTGGRCVL